MQTLFDDPLLNPISTKKTPHRRPRKQIDPIKYLRQTIAEHIIEFYSDIAPYAITKRLKDNRYHTNIKFDQLIIKDLYNPDIDYNEQYQIIDNYFKSLFIPFAKIDHYHIHYTDYQHQISIHFKIKPSFIIQINNEYLEMTT